MSEQGVDFFSTNDFEGGLSQNSQTSQPSVVEFTPSQFDDFGPTTSNFDPMSAAPTPNWEDEPPLLEELGIDFSLIYQRTMLVLHPFKSIEHGRDLEEGDLAGPFCFALLFGCLLLLAGKVHFGYIYGLGVFGCLAVYLLLNLMSERGVALYAVASVLGYGMVPLLLPAFLGIFFSKEWLMPVGYSVTLLVILWSAMAASNMFVAAMGMKDQRVLLMYPIGVFYSSFAAITIF